MKKSLFTLVLLSAHSLFAAGLTLNLPLVGRVTGTGGTVYGTAVDVTNNGSSAVAVDFFFDGRDAADGTFISIVGSIGNDGPISRGGGGLAPLSTYHSEDFINSLVESRQLSPSVRDHGIAGSLMLVFNGYSKRGQASAVARFSNAFGGGTVGVSMRAHEVEAGEPTQLVATARESSATYANAFINNTGLTPAGVASNGLTIVEVSAISAATGQTVGASRSVTLEPGETGTLSPLFQSLSIPPGSQSAIIVRAKVISGTAAIEGLISQVDTVTKDGSAFEMSRGDF